MLVTTSRYCKAELRDLAKALAKIFSGNYAARGKKTIDALVEEARKKGHSRLCVLMPNSLEFINVDELGQWQWFGERINFTEFELSGLGKIKPCSEISGEFKEKLSMLLDFEPNERVKECILFADATTIRYSCAEFNLEIGVSYEKGMQNTGRI